MAILLGWQRHVAVLENEVIWLSIQQMVQGFYFYFIF